MPSTSSTSGCKRDSWTAKEDGELLRLASSVGKKWSIIAAEMDGRTEGSVKARHALLAKRAPRGVTPQGLPPPHGDVPSRGAAPAHGTASTRTLLQPPSRYACYLSAFRPPIAAPPHPTCRAPSPLDQDTCVISALHERVAALERVVEDRDEAVRVRDRSVALRDRTIEEKDRVIANLLGGIGGEG